MCEIDLKSSLVKLVFYKTHFLVSKDSKEIFLAKYQPSMLYIEYKYLPKIILFY